MYQTWQIRPVWNTQSVALIKFSLLFLTFIANQKYQFVVVAFSNVCAIMLTFNLHLKEWSINPIMVIKIWGRMSTKIIHFTPIQTDCTLFVARHLSILCLERYRKKIVFQYFLFWLELFMYETHYHLTLHNGQVFIHSCFTCVQLLWYFDLQ